MPCQDCEGTGEYCHNQRCGKIEKFCDCNRPAISECRNCKGSCVEPFQRVYSPWDAYIDALAQLGDI